MENETIQEQMSSCKISMNAKGNFVFEVKDYNKSSAEAVVRAKARAEDLKVWCSEKNDS